MAVRLRTLVITDEHKRYLASRDPVMLQLIAQIPLAGLNLRTEYFAALARAVVGQQVSLHAARAIFARLEEACRHRLTPEAVHRLSPESLAQVGLSRRKIAYLRDLAEQSNGRKSTFHGWTPSRTTPSSKL